MSLIHITMWYTVKLHHLASVLCYYRSISCSRFVFCMHRFFTVDLLIRHWQIRINNPVGFSTELCDMFFVGRSVLKYLYNCCTDGARWAGQQGCQHWGHRQKKLNLSQLVLRRIVTSSDKALWWVIARTHRQDQRSATVIMLQSKIILSVSVSICCAVLVHLISF